VARAISGIIFENLRGFSEIYGLQVNIELVQGLLCKVARIFGFWNYFPMGKGGGLGPWVGGPRRGGWSTVPPWTPLWLMVGARRSLASWPLWAEVACREGGKAKVATRCDRGNRSSELTRR
jgi:hypothetical protein